MEQIVSLSCTSIQSPYFLEKELTGGDPQKITQALYTLPYVKQAFQMMGVTAEIVQSTIAKIQQANIAGTYTGTYKVDSWCYFC